MLVAGLEQVGAVPPSPPLLEPELEPLLEPELELLPELLLEPVLPLLLLQPAEPTVMPAEVSAKIEEEMRMARRYIGKRVSSACSLSLGIRRERDTFSR